MVSREDSILEEKRRRGRVYSGLAMRRTDHIFCWLILWLVLLGAVPSLSTAKEFEGKKIILSIKECIDLALKRNMDIIVERINPRIMEMEIIKEKSAFDPLFTMEVKNNKSINRPTSIISGAGSGTWLGEFLGFEENLEQEGFDFNTSITKKMITGGQCDLRFTNNRFKTNSFYQYSDKTYRSALTFSLRQPLLRSFGFDFNQTRIRIAFNNLDISADELKMKAVAVISELKETYFDVVATMEEMEVREQSLELAKNLLDRNQALVDAGRLAPIAILQAETGVASRKEGLLLAENTLKTAQDHLLKIIDLMDESSGEEKFIFPSDAPAFTEQEIDLNDSYQTAILNRPDFNRAKISLSNQELTFKSAKNQLLPKLDLSASYSLNGTDAHYRENVDSLSDGDTYSWEAGVYLEIPLGNRWAKSFYSQEKMKMRMAEIEFNDFKKKIFLEVKKAIRGVETNRERIKVTRSARILAEKKLKAEEGRFELGRSTTTDLLKFQEELSQAKSNENRALIDYQKSLIHWEAVTGQTFKKNGIEFVAS